MFFDGEIDSEFDRGAHGAGVGAVAAYDVEGCAVIGAGSDDGEA